MSETQAKWKWEFSELANWMMPTATGVRFEELRQASDIAGQVALIWEVLGGLMAREDARWQVTQKVPPA